MQPKWDRARRARVGMLVLAGGALFIGMLVFLVGITIGSRHVSYFVLLDENVKGLVVGSRVNFQGVPVGSVRDIRFQDGKTRVEISFDPTRAVIQDVTRAHLDRAWVTGQVTVELEGYQKKGGRALEPGATIAPVRSPLRELAETLPDMASDAAKLMVEWQKLAAQLNDLLAGDGGRHLGAILAHLDDLTSTLPTQVATAQTELRTLVAESRAMLASVRRSADAVAEMTTGPELRGTVAGAQRAVERFADLEEQLALLAREARGIMDSARSPLLRTLGSAQDALAELRNLARQLEIAPSSLIFGRPVRELAAPAK